MSFSSKVKEELINVIPKSRHCRIAEIAAIVYLDGIIHYSSEKEQDAEILVCIDNPKVVEKLMVLLRETLDKFNPDLKNEGRRSILRIKNEDAIKLLSMLKIDEEHLSVENSSRISRISNRLLTNTCCKRAFLRGVFLCTGSLTNPEKKYHFELALPDMDKALQMREVLGAFSMDAKIVQRKKQFVVYVKEAEGISDILNIMGAHISLLDMENIRILKGFRNNINRQVNCETANLSKTVSAATKKIEDIIYIRDKAGFSFLEPNLKEIAVLRLEHPEASLKELGEMLSEPLGKSGVNHRLRKLSSIARRLREQSEE